LRNESFYYPFLLLIWINISNKKYEKGKYSKLELIIGIFYIIILIIFTWTIIFACNYKLLYNIVNKIIMSFSILGDMFNVIFSGELLILMNIEKIFTNITYLINNTIFKTVDSLKYYLNNLVLKSENKESLSRRFLYYSGFKVKGSNIFSKLLYLILNIMYIIFGFIKGRIVNVFNIKY